MVDPSTYFSDDQMISVTQVAGLLLVSKLRDLLDLSGMLAAMAVGLTVSLLGPVSYKHLTLPTKA